MKSFQISKHIFLNFIVHLGDAISKNPGYLKLRKIRAAQSIAKTVIQTFSFNFIFTNCLLIDFTITKSCLSQLWLIDVEHC